MRTRMHFVILTVALTSIGCADVKFLAKEALIPAADATVKSAHVSKPRATVVVASTNVVQMAEKRQMHFTGMLPAHEFIYWAADNSRQVRHVDPDGTFSFLYPKQYKLVKVVYVYGDWGLSREFKLDPRYDYRWSPETKTFKPL